MKILIVGRTGTGKTTMADALANIGGLKVLKTTTTRAPRDAEDKARYNFVTKEEADKIAAKYLYTTIGETEYFCREDDLKACDVAILDPYGVQDITALLPDEIFQAIYMSVDTNNENAVRILKENLDQRIAHALNTGKTQAELDDKMAGENERFEIFEKMFFEKTPVENRPDLPPQPSIFHDSRFHGRIMALHDCKNDFEPETINGMAMNIARRLRQFKNMRNIMSQCADLEIINSPTPGMVATMDSATDAQELRPLDDATYAVLQNDLAFVQIMKAWMTHNLNINLPDELLPEKM